MSAAAGVLALLTGLAYTGLGLIAAYEMGLHASRRGFSAFGAAFMVMAFTCGPHHLAHAVHLLVEGERATAALLVSLALGIGPGVVFVGLRTETVLGGRGDRLLRGDPLLLTATPWALTLAAGAVLAMAVSGAGGRATAWTIVPNAILFAAYGLVGILVRITQAARRPLLGGWSLSGAAMANLFPTCGLSHMVAGLSMAPDAHTRVFDLAGVPASLIFLWVVYRVHSDALPDWNRRPLVGRAAATRRPAPWAAAAEER